MRIERLEKKLADIAAIEERLKRGETPRGTTSFHTDQVSRALYPKFTTKSPMKEASTLLMQTHSGFSLRPGLLRRLLKC